MTPASRWGWRILVTISALMALNGVALYAFIVETDVERTIGLLLAAVGAFALAGSIEGLRGGTAGAWARSWILVLALAALGAHSLRADRVDLPVWYLSLAALALLGQLLARPAGNEAAPVREGLRERRG